MSGQRTSRDEARLAVPPKLLRRMLGRLIPERDRTSFVGEMDALYGQRVSVRGRFRSMIWYTFEVVAFAIRLPVASAADSIAVRWPQSSWGRRAGGLASALWSDLRHASRRLVRRPGYALTVMVTLGVGVGGVVTVFAAANWILLRPVPGVDQPQEMHWIHLVSDQGAPMPVSHLDLLDLGRRTPGLLGLTASKPVDVHVNGPGDEGPVRLVGELVPASYFEVLQLRGVAGRTFDPDEHAGTTGPLEVIVSHDLAARLWSGREPALGRQLDVNGRLFTVIGVAPRGFRGADLNGRALLWLPVTAVAVVEPSAPNPAGVLTRRVPGLWLNLYGRARAGASARQIAAQLSEAARSVVDVEPMSSFMFFDAIRFEVTAGIGSRPGARATVRRTLTLLGGAAGLVLLLCLANVTNLTLARNASESGAVALRRALGASRLRVGAHLLSENVVLGIGGGLLALGQVFAVQRVFGGVRLSGLDARLSGMGLEVDALTGAVAAALAASLAAGALPAFMASRVARLPAAGIRSHRIDRSGGRLRNSLVVVQVALSTVLLVAAGLLVQTVANLRAVDVGLDVDQLAVVSLEPGLQGYDDAGTERQMERFEARLLEEPGVEAAGSIFPAPLRGWGLNWSITRAGTDGGETRLQAFRFKVSPRFFAAAGIELIAGSGFDAVAGGPADVVISERMAGSLFPDLNAAEVVGREVPNGGFRGETLRIIGVAKDARLISAHEPPPPIVFHRWSGGMQLGSLTTYIRVAGAPRDALAGIRTTAADVIPEVPIFDLRTARRQVDELFADQHTLARLAFALAALGALLAALGLHGVLACVVAERTREIGIRIALGARPARLIGVTVGRGMVLAAVGIAIGLLGTLMVNPMLENRLFGVTPFDPRIFTIGLGVVVVLSAAVSGLSARRAAGVDPIEALTRD